MAIWAALSKAAEARVLFRNGEALEQLAGVQALRFDKTGTLTTGTATVSKFVCDDTEHLAVLQTAAALANSSAHLFSRAIRKYVATTIPATDDVQRNKQQLTQSQNIPGMGIVAESISLADQVWLGSLRLMQENQLVVSAQLQQAIENAYAGGLAITCIGWQGTVRGLFVFKEQLRPQVRDMMRWCRQTEIDVAVLTGDHAQRGALLEQELQVPVIAELLPDQKVLEIANAQQAHGVVAMVGDGMNDAPALMAADIGIAMGCGADLSRDSAAVCLLGNNLNRIPWSIELARLTVQTIKRNLGWAFGYNSLGILVAATGYLNPAFAALLMILSSLLVITSSLRLKSVIIPAEEAFLEKQTMQRAQINPSEEFQPQVRTEPVVIAE